MTMAPNHRITANQVVGLRTPAPPSAGNSTATANTTFGKIANTPITAATWALTAGYALSDRASCRGMAHSTDLRERIINAVIHKRYSRKPQTRSTLEPPPSAATSAAIVKFTPQTSPGRPSALVDHQAWVEQSLIGNDLTHDQRCDLLFDEIGVRIAEPPCAAGYRDWDRREKKTIYAGEQGPEARWRYLAWIGGIDPHRSVFVDESGFNLATTPPYAYAPRGQRAVGRVPKSRGENTSLVAAISLDEGVSDAMTSTGAVAGVAF